MGLPAGEGLAVLYNLASEWTWRRDVLTLLGAEDPARLDTALEQAGAGRRRGAAERRAEVAEFVAAMGGEFVGG